MTTESNQEIKTQIIRGVSIGWLANAAGVVVTFFTTPIILTGLGDVRYGIWSIVMSFAGYYGLADLGLGKATAKYVSQYDSIGDTETVKKILATTLRTYLFLALILMFVSVVVAWGFPLVFDNDAVQPATMSLVVLLIGLRVSVQLLGSTYRSALIAYKRLDLTNVIGIASQISGAVAMISVIKFGGGLAEMAAAVVGIGVVIELLTWRCAVNQHRLPKFSLRDATDDTREMMLGFGILTVVASSAQQLSRNSGAIIGGLIVGPAAVAYYSIAHTLTQKCSMLAKPVGQAALPTASQFQAQDDMARLAAMAEQAICLLLGFAFGIIITIHFFIYDFISYWISVETAEKSHLMMCIFSFSLVGSLPNSVIIQILQGMGRVNFTARLGIAEATAVIIIALPMTAWFGMTGMATTLSITTLFFRGLIQGGYLIRLVRIGYRRLIRRCFVPAMLSAIPVAFTSTILNLIFTPTNLAYAVSLMFASFAVSAVSVFAFCLPYATKRHVVTAFTARFTRPNAVNSRS